MHISIRTPNLENAMSQTPYIFDVTSANFEQLVLENSFHKPVLVDFWAEWCAPCKALMPLLAKITEEYQGQLLLAKVNCDIEQDVVARFGVRSLPTVVLFKDGQPIDGFAGAQPESAVRAMLQPHVQAAPAPEADLLEAAQTLFAEGRIGEAEQQLQQLLAEDNENAAALILYARCLAERDRQLAIIHEGLDPDRSPAAAFDRALLADVLALPTGAGDSHRRNARAVQARWQAARRRWPRDLDLAWFAARNCSKSLGCDSDGALQHLLEVDPGNAAAWVMAMEAALEDGDAGAYDRALQRAAAARTYDTRSGVAYLRLQPLLSLVRRPAECLGTSSLGEAEKLLGRPLKIPKALEHLTINS